MENSTKTDKFVEEKVTTENKEIVRKIDSPLPEIDDEDNQLFGKNHSEKVRLNFQYPYTND